MRLGLGLSIGSSSGGGFVSPASLALSMYHKPNYPGSLPWSGTASGGTSGDGSHDWLAGTAPAAGTAVNGKTPASFNGTTHHTLAEAAVSNCFGATAYDVIVLCKVASTVAASGTPINDKPIMGELNGNYGLVFTTSGLMGVHNDGAYKATAAIAQATGAWFMARHWYDGSIQRISVNNGTAAVSAACGAPASMASLFLKLGKNYTTTFTAYDVLESIVSPTVISDANVANIKAYFNTEYGLSL